ncbi:lipoprotein [Propionimicrobium lymphophilum]|uniref:lipoprotein n=1 Tax=Propionimicrobium lymphophilum TaxID=33012 RepID=UPI0023F14A18|nr:lipoprotein [Propionimicrobium lymphophilum]
MRRIFLAILTALLLAGCGQTSLQPAPSSSQPSVDRVPSGAASLRSFGLENGPENFYLPVTADFYVDVDQENNVTLTMTPEQGRILVDFLVENLPAMGYVVISTSSDAIIFEGPWKGGLTISDKLAALTLRS